MSPKSEEIRKKDVIDHLTWDHSVNANDVQVIVKEHNVQLKGTVPNQTAKMAAERDAYQVKGVNHVDNFLDVEYPPSLVIPGDKEIESNVKNILTWDSRVDSSRIDVHAEKGVIRLKGTASSYWEKRKAYEIAFSVGGVIGVFNQLVVKPKQSILDKDIESDIENAFSRSILIDEDKILVKVKNGIAYLSGVVSNNLIKNEIQNVAMYTEGVVDVDDTELTIG